MSPTVASIAFCIIVIVIVLHINMKSWDADELWKRQEARLREQGIVAQRPDDWDARVGKQRAQMIYITLAGIMLLTVWFVASMYIYN